MATYDSLKFVRAQLVEARARLATEEAHAGTAGFGRHWGSRIAAMRDRVLRLGTRARNLSRSVLVCALVVLAGGTARAEEQGPFHPCPPTYEHAAGPQPPHPRAWECAVDDRACVRAHDAHALEVAYRRGWDRQEKERACGEVSTEAGARACLETVRMLDGDVPPSRPSDPVLSDPCATVVRVDSGMAQLYSRALRATTLVRSKNGWRAGQRIGRCDVDALVQTVRALPVPGERGVTQNPGFPWGGGGKVGAR